MPRRLPAAKKAQTGYSGGTEAVSIFRRYRSRSWTPPVRATISSRAFCPASCGARIFEPARSAAGPGHRNASPAWVPVKAERQTCRKCRYPETKARPLAMPSYTPLQLLTAAKQKTGRNWPELGRKGNEYTVLFVRLYENRAWAPPVSAQEAVNQPAGGSLQAQAKGKHACGDSPPAQTKGDMPGKTAPGTSQEVKRV